MSAPSPSTIGPDDSITVPTAASHGLPLAVAPAPGPRRAVDLAPTTIDRFRILATLGQGGMGIVYEAHDPTLDRFVAIKLVHRRLSEREGKRLHREAQSLARLSHPNVVQVFEVGRGPQGMYLVMERIRGRSLRQWLAARPRAPAEILAMFLQAGEGLAAAHAAGMVHRDFKPGNVLVGDDGRARVLDFGLARVGRTSAETDEGEPSASRSAAMLPRDVAGHDDATLPATRALAIPPASASAPAPDALGEDLVAARLTDHDAVLGTPAYMAPEQHLGRPLTPAADQFGFCVALYEALFHAHPFGPAEDRLHRVLTGMVEPPPTTSPIAEPVRAAILRGLSFGPDDRFPSMVALLHALRPPPRRSRLALAAVLVTGTAGLAFAVWSLGAPAGPDPCVRGPALLAHAWDDQREAVEAGLLATGLPYAADTWELAEARLSAYADAWREAYAHTCEASLHGALPPAEHDARMRCLDERRLAVAALVGTLAGADASTVQHAVSAAGQLPPVAECDDPEVLARTMAALAAEATTTSGTPDDPEAVGRLREGLATLRAYHLTGDHARGLGLAAELRPQVLATHHGPLLSELELHTGMLQIRAADPAAASLHLQAAYFLAKELAHDRVALEAAMNLVFVAGNLQHDAKGAQTWLDHAAAELPRGGTPSLRASFEGLRGVVAAHAQRHEEAAAHHARAAELQAAVHGPASPAVARSLANHGSSLAWTGRFDESIATLERAIAMAEQQLGPRHPDVALHLNNLGIILHNHGSPAAARVQLARALAIREQILEPDHLDIANTLEQLGRVYVGEGRPAEARPLLERALEIRTRKQGPEHLQLAFTLGSLGELQLSQGEAAAAEQSFRRALEMADTVAPGHPFIAYAQSWLGQALVHQERWDAATTELRGALSRIEAAHGPVHLELVGPLQGLAGAALAQGNAAEALAAAERALAVGEEAQLPTARLAIARWQVAQALWDTGGDRARARRLAEEVAHTWKDDPGQTERLADVQRWLASRPPERARPATPSRPAAAP